MYVCTKYVWHMYSGSTRQLKWNLNRRWTNDPYSPIVKSETSNFVNFSRLFYRAQGKLREITF